MSKFNRESFKAAHPVVLEPSALEKLDVILKEAEANINGWLLKRAEQVADKAIAVKMAEIDYRKLDLRAQLRAEERLAKKGEDNAAEIADLKATLAGEDAKKRKLENERDRIVKEECRSQSYTQREVDVNRLGGEQFKRSSFEELERELSNKIGAVEWVRATVGNFSVKTSLTISIHDGVFSNNITVEHEQGEAQVLDDMFEKVKSLIIENYVPPWQRRWSSLRGYTFIVVIVSLALAMGALNFTTTDDARSRNLKEAKELIDRGVKPEDLHAAVDVLLRLQTNYPSSPRTSFSVSHRLIALSAGLLVAGVMLACGPKGVMVAIGDGKKAIASWKKLTRWLVGGASLLGLALLEAIKPAIFETLWRWLSG